MNKKIRSILIVIIFSLALISLTTVCYAASFVPGISGTDIKVGDTITVTAKADNAAGMYNVKISDTSILEVVSGATSEFLENSSATIKLKAKKAGTATVSVTPSDMTDLDDSTKSVTKGGKTYTVKVTAISTDTDKNNENKDTDKNTTTNKDTDTTNKNTTTIGTNKNNTTTTAKPKEKSSNAYLSTLGVTPKEYDFSDFSKTKYSYNVTVPSDVDSLKVLYKTADPNAKVNVSGNSGFDTGSKNKITIKVTAEDGKTTKTYTIKVTKLTEEEDKPGNVIEDEKGLYLTSLDIEGLELAPKFVKDTYSYTATLSDSNVNEVTVNAVANKENANVDISGNTDLVEGENTINILVTLPYSAEQTVYQIIVNKEEALPTGTTNPSDSNNSFNLMELMNGYVGIAISILVFLIIIVIVLIILLRKDSKKRKQEYNYYATEEEIEEDGKTEEYNVFENDENEFANNDIEKDNFIESLYKQRNGDFEEELTEGEKETLDEIKEQTDKIFEEKEIEGQSVEHSQSDFGEENPLEERRRRRGKGRGKHF